MATLRPRVPRGRRLATARPLVILRPYQTACKRTTTEWVESGRDPLNVLATGLGKTVIFGSHCIDLAGAGKRAIVLAHKVDLITQTEQRILQIDRLAPVGVVWRNRREYHLPIVVASRDSLRGKKRLREIAAHHYDLVVVDEYHNFACKTYSDIMDALRVGNPNIRLVGFTATPSRADQASLVGEGMCTGKAFERSLSWGIEKGFLAPLRGIAVETHVDLTGLKTSRATGDYRDGDLAPLIDTDERNGLLVESWRDHADGRPTLAFCVDINHSRRLAESFANAGIEAGYVSSTGAAIFSPPILKTSQLKTHEVDRAGIRSASQSGAIGVATNPVLLGEGSDWPWLECIMTARPASEKAIGRYAQWIGRGTRLSPQTGKVDCLVLDSADNTRHNIATLGDVLDGGEGIKRREAERKAAAEKKAEDDETARRRRQHVGLVVTAREVAILAKQTTMQVDAPKSSPLPPIRWVSCDPLGAHKTAAVSLDHQKGALVLYPAAIAGGGLEYRVALASKATDGAVLCTVGTGPDAQAASADARGRVGAMGLRYSPTAFWRRNGPTEGQKKALAGHIARDRGLSFWDARAEAETMTVGQTCGDVSAWLGYLSAVREWAKQRSEAA